MKNQKFVSIVLSVVLSFLGVAVLAYAATTIGTNILTAGTLGVSGLTTLGNATTTIVDVSNYLAVGGNATTTSNGNILTNGTLGVTGKTSMANASTTSNVDVAGYLAVGGNATTTSAGNISTNGTLGVTSTSNFTGKVTMVNASSTQLSVAGGLWVNGLATTTATGIFSPGRYATGAGPTCDASVAGGLTYNATKRVWCFCDGLGTWQQATSSAVVACY